MSKLTVKTVNELEKVSEGARWLIEGLWLNKGIGILAAQPKTGKSFLAMDMAVSISCGVKALNKFDVKNAHKVLIFFAEDTESIQRDRIELIKKAKGIEGDTPNLHVLTAENGLRLDTEDGIKALRQVVMDIRPALLILDPFIRMHQISESDSGAVSKVLSELRRLKDEFECGVLVVHHSTKGAKSARGSTEFPAWGETNLFMYKDKTESIFLDIQHRAVESTNGIPLKIGELNEGVSVYVVEKHEPKVEGTEKPALDLSEDVQVLNVVSRHIPTGMDTLMRKCGLNKDQLLVETYQLIKSGRIRWTNKGYLKI